MKSVTAIKLVALLSALLLTAGEFLLLEYDVQQRQAAYRAEAASVSAPRG
jgi:hypothetical protein